MSSLSLNVSTHTECFYRCQNCCCYLPATAGWAGLLPFKDTERKLAPTFDSNQGDRIVRLLGEFLRWAYVRLLGEFLHWANVRLLGEFLHWAYVRLLGEFLHWVVYM
jgi:hypothetical protein